MSKSGCFGCVHREEVSSLAVVFVVSAEAIPAIPGGKQDVRYFTCMRMRLVHYVAALDAGAPSHSMRPPSASCLISWRSHAASWAWDRESPPRSFCFSEA